MCNGPTGILLIPTAMCYNVLDLASYQTKTGMLIAGELEWTH